VASEHRAEHFNKKESPMQSATLRNNAVQSANPMHGTLEDVSWDLGSVQYRVGELENMVKQMKSEIHQLRNELREIGQEERPSKTATSPVRSNDLSMP
jgi:predicted RNase H-like nuclease (RuvC/YqgF family)